MNRDLSDLWKYALERAENDDDLSARPVWRLIAEDIASYRQPVQQDDLFAVQP